jgi:predicted Zn-dependent protease
MSIPGAYFDGKTSRRFEVELSVTAGIALIRGEFQRECPISELRVSERTRHVARKVTFPDGAYLEVLDDADFHRMLKATDYRDSAVVHAQQSWRGTFVACVLTAVVLAFGYVVGLPTASEVIAKALPEKIERAIGGETLNMLDERFLAPSKLSEERRNEITARFNELAAPKEGAPTYTIIFRKRKIGPNAFALPWGQIVLTDEIVELVGNDDTVIGVLAHELGHLHERHLIRRIIQSPAIAVVAMTLTGDVSSIVAGLPALMLDLKYSRDAEHEADDYAIAMLKANGIDPSNLALLFEKIGEYSRSGPSYFSTHPAPSNRIARILDAR